MWRACLRTFGRCRQAGDTANHSGIEDQVIEDQQASLQRDRRLSASRFSITHSKAERTPSSIDEFVNRRLSALAMSLVSAYCGGRRLALLHVRKRNAENSEDGQRGSRLYTKR